MEPSLTDSPGTETVLQDELRHVHHRHMGRLLSMPEEGGNGDDLMMGLEEDDGLVMGMGMRGD